MTSALERVNAFATTGRIDRAGLRALRDEIEVRAPPRPERAADQPLRLRPRAPEPGTAEPDADAARRTGAAQPRDGIARHRPAPGPEAGRGHHRRVDGCRRCCRPCWTGASSMRARTSSSASTSRAGRCMRGWLAVSPTFRPTSCPRRTPRRPAQRLETVPWQLLRRLAQTLGLVVQRDDKDGSTQLTLEFPRTVNDGVATLATLEFDEPGAAGAELAADGRPARAGHRQPARDAQRRARHAALDGPDGRLRRLDRRGAAVLRRRPAARHHLRIRAGRRKLPQAARRMEPRGARRWPSSRSPNRAASWRSATSAASAPRASAATSSPAHCPAR